MSTFQQPGISSPEDKFAPSESNGALLLFFPRQLQEQVKTAHGESDAVACRIVRLNDGRVWDNALVFSTALVTQLKAAIPDGMVLGTLGQGENTKGNPPWLLSPHDAEQVAIAEQWLAANPRQAQPAPVAPAAPAAAWGQAPSAAPTAGGWGSAPVQTPPNAAPIAPGWGAQPAAPATTPAAGPTAATAGQWGNAAPAPAPAVSADPVDPGLAEALRRKGVNLPGDATMQTALGIWAIVEHNPDVVA